MKKKYFFKDFVLVFLSLDTYTSFFKNLRKAHFWKSVQCFHIVDDIKWYESKRNVPAFAISPDSGIPTVIPHQTQILILFIISVVLIMTRSQFMLLCRYPVWVAVLNRGLSTFEAVWRRTATSTSTLHNGLPRGIVLCSPQDFVLRAQE